LLEDIVNGLKHGRPRREGDIVRATDIYEITILTEYEDDDGPYQDVSKVVEVKLKNGSVRNLEDVLTTVVNMWIMNFQAQGLLSGRRPIAPRAHQVPPRKTVSGAAPLDYAMTQGVRFKALMRRQKYNYATGQVEGLDMTDHRYVFSIRKPLEATLVMRNNATGQVIERTVQLSADEQVSYEGLKTEEERDQFMNSLKSKYARQVLESK
jgi:hypothetical protein